RNLVAKQDANGNLTTFEYDELGRRTAEHVHLDGHPRLTSAQRDAVPLFEPGAESLSDVGTLSWHTTYDSNNNLLTFIDAKGQVTTSVHELLNRLETRTFSNHALPRALPSIEAQSFTYDENGNLTHITETKLTDVGPVQQTTVHTYDRLDRRESTTLPSNKSLSFDYYPAGQRKYVTAPDGVSTVYTYDALGRLSTASIPEGTTSFNYWPDSLPKATILPNGLIEKRCYDATSRLSTIVLVRGTASENCAPEGVLLSSFAYEYDNHGNRLRQTEARTRLDTGELAAPETTQYGYDALDRLTGVAYPDGRAVLYRLDAVGNRTGEREAPSSALPPSLKLGPESFSAMPLTQLSRDTFATFNRADWLLTLSDSLDTSQSRTLIYDANGNLSSLLSASRARTLSWDIRNTLTAVNDNGQELGRYDYDANLQRTWRRAAQENVAYVLDDGFIVGEVDESRLTRRRYHYAQRPFAISDITGTSITTRFLNNDALGSVSDVTSSAGDVTATRKYDAWGKHRGQTAPEAKDFKLGFTGHQFDMETGLTYARARYYDSESGRFISRDTHEGVLGDAPSLHRYAYANINPLRFVDPTGHAPDDTASRDRINSAILQVSSACAGGNATACNERNLIIGTFAVGLAGGVGLAVVAEAGGVVALYEAGIAKLTMAGGAVVVGEAAIDGAGVITGGYGCGVLHDPSACRDMTLSGLDLLTGPLPFSEESLARRATTGFRRINKVAAMPTKAVVTVNGATTTEAVETLNRGTLQVPLLPQGKKPLALLPEGKTPVGLLPSGEAPKLLPAKTTTRQNLETLQVNDSNRAFRLSKVNAETALAGPEGSTINVAGPSGAGRDVTFRQSTSDGVTVHRREVKSITGGQSAFNTEIGHAAKQVEYDGHIFVQVPEGTDAMRTILRFRGSRPSPAEKGMYRSVTTTVVDPSGKVLYDGPLMP
ncbi:MAG: hypothetical protein JXB05_28515, partial [Myxococcaceae bacterium]|nr:hypothetical protein [Myxococcaceae bacterium]